MSMHKWFHGQEVDLSVVQTLARKVDTTIISWMLWLHFYTLEGNGDMSPQLHIHHTVMKISSMCSAKVQNAKLQNTVIIVS